jgi:RNA polymerase sigma-70 factor (ECF subfamily)
MPNPPRRAGEGAESVSAPWSADGPPAPNPGPAPVPAEEAADARLVERAILGDDAAFGGLVVRYERKLVRVLARLVQDEELARDLAQETFWKVYTRLDRFDTSRRFGPWLFRIGVRLGLDYLRRSHPQVRSIDRPGPDGWRAAELPDPDPREGVELAQEVRHVLDRLPVEYRTVLVLRDLEGFSSAEVAAIVERQEATVRWRLARAREMFRQHWERRHGPGRGPGSESEAGSEAGIETGPDRARGEVGDGPRD